MEEWKEYKISSYGRILGKRGGIMCPFIASGGGYRIGLCLDGKNKNYYIHRLVALHFIPTEDTTLEIDHIDGDKANNHISNLRWVTGEENRGFVVEQGLLTYQAKGLYWGDIYFESIRELARHISEEYNTNTETTRKALQGVKYGKKSYKGKSLLLAE